MKKITGAILFALLTLGLSCGCESNRQVFKRYESQFADKRQQFKKIADSLPATGSANPSPATNLSPKPVYDPKSDTNNTEIVMFDQLQDPDIQSEDHNRLDLILSGNLLLGMKWTGPKSPMSESVIDKRAESNLDPMLKKGLSTRYLVVLRPATFTKPVAADENNYQAGSADIEGFLVDLEGNKILASFRFTANSADRVEYSYKPGQNKESQLEEFAYSSLYTDARDKLSKALPQSTGGNFNIEK